MIFYKKINLFLIISVFCLAISCNSGTDDETKIDDQITTVKVTKDTADINKVKVIFYNVPSPVEMTNIIQKAGISYNPELLNSLKNTNKYITTSKIALNLGIYGADLSYVRMFDQIQESVNYLAAIKKFSDKLGIPNDKGTFTVERLEDNVNNRDSLLNIIAETYANADVYLKENNRGSTAALIILGGWIEALFVATSIVDEKNQYPEIMKRIGEQKYSLNNMIDLMNTYKQDETVAFYMPQLEELRKIYDKINITSSKEPEAKTDKANKVTTIDSKSETKITMPLVKEIRESVIKIRAQIIK